jgi:hypothetical protein
LKDLDTDAHPDLVCGGDDCNDANPLVWQSPVEVADLTITTAEPADPTWSSQAVSAGPETTYDLVSGPVGPGPGMNYPASVCLQSGETGTTYSDTRATPPAGTGFWYLVRARNSCGVGTYGTVARDSTITACP